jgi:hypothetical protein
MTILMRGGEALAGIPEVVIPTGAKRSGGTCGISEESESLQPAFAACKTCRLNPVGGAKLIDRF